VEHPDGGAPEQTAQAVPTAASAARKPGRATSASPSRAQKLTNPGQGTVNINTASVEELQRLPGVGPSYAVRILQFRKENGPFTSADQLMDVSGIGPKKFEKIKPFVRLK
jgi:competence protein ComEA